ncbi:MAG: hypothetical protein Q3972_03750 [Corynebacterium sp.]|nr:hypothetical protein [Corynebacterium sp.]
MNAKAKNLDVEERRAGRVVDLGPSRGTLIAALVLYLVSLVLPWAGPVKGFNVLLHDSTAAHYATTMPEYVYVYTTFLSIVVINIIVLFTKNFVFSVCGWVLGGVGLFYSLFAMWMRQTNPVVSASSAPTIGMIFGAIAAFLVCWGYTGLLIRRTEAQQRLAEARIEASREATDDPVADAQLRLLAEQEARAKGTYDDGDHRRSRNHNRGGE